MNLCKEESMITNKLLPLESTLSRIFVSLVLAICSLTLNFAEALTYTHLPSQDLKYFAEDGTPTTLHEVLTAYKLENPASPKGGWAPSSNLAQRKMIYKKLAPVYTRLRVEKIKRSMGWIEDLMAMGFPEQIREDRQNLIGVGPLYKLITDSNFTQLNNELTRELDELVEVAYDSTDVVVMDIYGRETNAEKEKMYGHGLSATLSPLLGWLLRARDNSNLMIPNDRQILTVAIYTYVFFKNELGELDEAKAGLQEICSTINLQDNTNNTFDTLCPKIQTSQRLKSYIDTLSTY